MVDMYCSTKFGVNLPYGFQENVLLPDDERTDDVRPTTVTTLWQYSFAVQ